jgi:spore maturation protein CgeB
MRMMPGRLRIVVFGLSLTSSWGNGHATTYRALLGALSCRGHRVTFFERDQAWYAAHRDLPKPAFCDFHLYTDLDEIERPLRAARPDIVVVGSFVPEGAELAHRLLRRSLCPIAFYDIDTPVTLAALEQGECEYLSRDLIPQFDLYLSFSGGPVLTRLEREFGATRPRALYCSVDPESYFPMARARRYDLGYLGTYSADRQPALEGLLIEGARRWREGRFCVAGAQYPKSIDWPANVERREHIAPRQHCSFYNSQRLTLNLTRADMRAAGHSPSVRLFEAAACGVPIVSDRWAGLEEIFVPGTEILVADTAAELLRQLREDDPRSLALLGERARARVLAQHTALHRAAQFEEYMEEAWSVPTRIPLESLRAR